MSDAASRLARRIIIALGLLIALVGLTLDYLLPGSSPGISLPQLLVVFAGVGLAASPVLWWRWRGSQPIQRRYRGLLALLIALATLLALELALTTSGIAPYFPAQAPDASSPILRWEACGELGCLYSEMANRHPSCLADEITKRFCIANSQGFADRDEFVWDEAHAERDRILMLGDSFAYGQSADIGKSYVERVEAALEDAVVWNLGVRATGTNQDLRAFQRFAPTLNPRLAILGFFTNDFGNNLLLPEDQAMLELADGRLSFVERFPRDRWGSPLDLSVDLVYAYWLADYHPPASDLELVVGRTRLGALGLRALDMLALSRSGRSWVDQVSVTRHYLTELRQAAASQGSDLLTLMIPRREDIETPRMEYQTAVDLMRELGIPYLEVRQRLHPVDDYAPLPDGHWNNSGHGVAAAELLYCLELYFVADSLHACDNVAMP